MASTIHPLITFKAGKCEGETHIRCLPEPGLLYLYMGLEDELLHFCWRPRSQSADHPALDLLMFPGDASFVPYTGKDSNADSDIVKSPTSGRICALKFSSSSQRHLFWLQSKPEHTLPNRFSQRDLEIASMVNRLLSGEEVEFDLNLTETHIPDNDDEDMEDADGPPNPRLRANSTGGAGAGATGGDVREEGEEAREGGADGARAAAVTSATSMDDATSALVQNLLNSLPGTGKAGTRPAAQQENIFTTLSDLLTPETCVPVIQSASPALLDSLLSNLPPAIILLETRSDDLAGTDPTPTAAEEALKSLSEGQKKALLIRVLHSPQLHQSLGSLTVALRDGGLPSVAGALNIDVENEGFIRGGAMPLGGGDAVEAFLKGVERTVKKEEGKEEQGQGDEMDTA